MTKLRRLRPAPTALEEWVGVALIAGALALWLPPLAAAWVGGWLLLDANTREG